MLLFRAITNSALKRESAVITSSTSPSAKYSCSGSPLMFVNGRTAMEGLSGSGSGFVSLRRGRVHSFGMPLAPVRIGEGQRLSHVTVSRAVPAGHRHIGREAGLEKSKHGGSADV